MNPCPCGYLGHYSGKCRCSPRRVAAYRERISGPLLDRIDLHVELPALREEELMASEPGEASRGVRSRVVAARAAQLRRHGRANADLSGREAEELARLDAEGRRVLRDAIARLRLSARAHHRMLKVARTAADLAGSETVLAEHLAEAIAYRGAAALPALAPVTA